jgi:hypothetical protein
MCLLLLDFWIVDASIARTVGPFSFGGCFVWVFVFVVCVFAVLMMVPLLARGCSAVCWWGSCGGGGVVVFVECLFGKL